MSVIKVENLSKNYRYGVIGHGTLYRDLQSWWARLRGREDPNSRITEHAGPGLEGEFFRALDDISFEVKQGEALGIIGRNGAGKSTLLKILSRVTTPSDGLVKLRGRVASLLEVGTGFHPELTGRENIFLNGAILGMSRSEVRSKFDEIVTFSGIEKFVDTPVKRYSSGMFVRLAFSVAAHLEPEILLVDEVLAVGDAQFQKMCIDKMNSIVKEGRTILFVSHQMECIANLCSRVLHLEKGRIKAGGTAREIIEHYLSSCRSTAAVPLKNRKDRRGRGHIKFTDTWVEDKSGSRSARAQSGRPLTIVAEYVSDYKTPVDVRVAIALNASNGIQLTDLSNSSAGNVFKGLFPERGLIKCRIPELPLNMGNYTYNLFLSVGSEMEDFILDAGAFDVEAGDFFNSGVTVDKRQGMVLIKQNWEITSSS